MSTKTVETPPDPEIAYDLIAGHYDQFTAHHDYELWFENLLPALEAEGLSGNRLLDAGCGTGKSSIPMINRGWQVTCSDRSDEMLDRLRPKVGDQVRIEQADLRRMRHLGEFDLILCLGDVLNYCAVESPLEDALTGLGDNLAPGGLLLFDLNTLLTYRTFYAELQEVEFDGHRVTWQGLGDGRAGPGDLAESVMEIFPADGSESTRAVHRQRHVPEVAVRAALDGAGLECIAVYGQGFDAELQVPVDDSRHTKTIYIAKVRNHEERRR